MPYLTKMMTKQILKLYQTLLWIWPLVKFVIDVAKLLALSTRPAKSSIAAEKLSDKQRVTEIL